MKSFWCHVMDEYKRFYFIYNIYKLLFALCGICLCTSYRIRYYLWLNLFTPILVGWLFAERTSTWHQVRSFDLVCMYECYQYTFPLYTYFISPKTYVCCCTVYKYILTLTIHKIHIIFYFLHTFFELLRAFVWRRVWGSCGRVQFRYGSVGGAAFHSLTHSLLSLDLLFMSRIRYIYMYMCR